MGWEILRWGFLNQFPFFFGTKVDHFSIANFANSKIKEKGVTCSWKSQWTCRWKIEHAEAALLLHFLTKCKWTMTCNHLNNLTCFKGVTIHGLAQLDIF